jgi:hypothetical protein
LPPGQHKRNWAGSKDEEKAESGKAESGNEADEVWFPTDAPGICRGFAIDERPLRTKVRKNQPKP